MATSDFMALMQDVEEQALADCLDLADAIVENMLGPDGETYGDMPLDRGQRIARVEDMARTGTLDCLKTICDAVNAPWYDRIIAQYVEDVRNSPLIRGVA